MSVRVAITVTGGPVAGRRVVLKSGQVAQFGRSHWADFAFPEDDQMEDSHFEMAATPDGVFLRRLKEPAIVLVNGQPASLSSMSIQSGTKIQAGRSQFSVEVSGASSPVAEGTIAPESAADKTVKVAKREEALERLTYLGMDEVAGQLVQPTTSLKECALILAQNKLWKESFQWVAYHAIKSDSVAWASQWVRRHLTALSPSSMELNGLGCIEQWTIQPTEENRLLCKQLALSLKQKGIFGALACAVMWSDGSLAPEDLPVVQPDPRLTSHCVALALSQLLMKFASELRDPMGLQFLSSPPAWTDPGMQ